MNDLLKSRRGGNLLGLSLEAGRVDAALLHRTNGSVGTPASASVPLPAALLNGPPEALGKEIRRALDDAGIKERRCAVALPAAWVLTLQVDLPELPESDLASLIQLEAERGFPHSPDSLVIAESRYAIAHAGPGGTAARFATLLAVPRERIARLEAALAAAQLIPLTFNLALPEVVAALDPKSSESLTLLPADEHLGVMLSFGGGIVLLRQINAAFSLVEGRPQLDLEHVRRELRITLAQLPSGIRDSLRRLQVLGQDAAADSLANALSALEPTLGLTVERTRTLPAQISGVVVPAGTAPGPATVVALRPLVGDSPLFDFLPPKISAWQRLTERYSSRRVAGAGMIFGALAALVAIAFLIQEIQLWHWNGRWQAMAKKVGDIEQTQGKTRRYKPWFDESVRSLGVLRRLTEAFPEDGSVSAKSIELRAPTTVICTGSAKDRASFLRMFEKLRAAPEVGEVKLEQMRGKSPLEFTFNFQWVDRSSP